jgi:hypothetical protein
VFDTCFGVIACLVVSTGDMSGQQVEWFAVGPTKATQVKKDNGLQKAQRVYREAADSYRKADDIYIKTLDEAAISNNEKEVVQNLRNKWEALRKALEAYRKADKAYRNALDEAARMSF